MRGYQSVVSIGSQCLTATLLEELGWKHFSGPFDWIFSNLRMVCDCIETDFSDFLDPHYIAPVPPEARREYGGPYANHRHYQRRYGLPTVFNHHDPSTAEGHDYLVRCVDRFRALLAADRPVLLLGFSRRDQGGLYAFDRLCALLEDAPHVDLCVFVIDERAGHQAVELWEARGRHRLHHLHLLSAVDGISFEDKADIAYVLGLLREMIVLEDASQG